MSRRPRILDAGCGRQFYVDYPGLGLRDGNGYVVGIDISQSALDQNEQVDEKILGDIQTYPLKPESFDIVISEDVLEHLPHPDLALANMTRALRPGGELIASLSNPASVKGMVTKLTPHWFHHLVYKRGWFGYEYVDDPAYPPFKTYLRWSLRPSALRRKLEQLGFSEIDLRCEDFGETPFGRRSEMKVRARKVRHNA